MQLLISSYASAELCIRTRKDPIGTYDAAKIIDTLAGDIPILRFRKLTTTTFAADVDTVAACRRLISSCSGTAVLHHGELVEVDAVQRLRPNVHDATSHSAGDTIVVAGVPTKWIGAELDVTWAKTNRFLTLLLGDHGAQRVRHWEATLLAACPLDCSLWVQFRAAEDADRAVRPASWRLLLGTLCAWRSITCFLRISHWCAMISPSPRALRSSIAFRLNCSCSAAVLRLNCAILSEYFDSFSSSCWVNNSTASSRSLRSRRASPTASCHF